jgi:RHS repeat-associated protein
VDSSGTVVWKAVYFPFGKTQILTETITNNIRFPGQYFDAETGLHYNWNRYYDPYTGRYLTPDPIGLDGGMNLFAYANGNPVNSIDPEGLFIFTATFGITALTITGDVALVQCGINHPMLLAENYAKCRMKK